MRLGFLEVLSTLSLHTDKHIALFKAGVRTCSNSVSVKTSSRHHSEIARRSDFRKQTKKRKNPTMRITTRDAIRTWPFTVGSKWLSRVISEQDIDWADICFSSLQATWT